MLRIAPKYFTVFQPAIGVPWTGKQRAKMVRLVQQEAVDEGSTPRYRA
jgi:hypothetical protein